MEIHQLLRLIGRIGAGVDETSTGRAAADAARHALVDRGARAVGPLLRVLTDEDPPVDWTEAAALLRRIGEPALRPLAAVIAAAPTRTAAVRAGWTFSGLELHSPTAYAPALAHPHPRVREAAAHALQQRGPAALPAARLLLPLLADPVAEVRAGAGWALADAGPGVLPLLREVRRARAPAGVRRTALELLAAVGGPAALDARDAAAVRRLIRIRAPGEVPEPMHLCGPWFALPTGDLPAVLDAFGLSGAERVTMRLGASAWRHDHHSGADHGACARMYVSPVLDGWTLVFGTATGEAHRPAGEPPGGAVLRRCTALSRRFGTAHWYGARCADDWSAWCFAERGEVVRFYDATYPEQTAGARHPAEPADALPHEAAFADGAFADVDALVAEAFLASYEAVTRDLGIAGPRTAALVAGRASVNPLALGPGTRAEGAAVLALTACGRTFGHPPGALRI
ncbi:HEAT repeat domain-containing protein [Streptomyces sp. MP131-18]|uniref:HEAT repeat domain-containing protein n=1 Tax=Streptomyces sp. MP131-18 TaxID=1857892 RepID=UPI0009A16E3E|nr:HEAT repeat domain-containing protein [Streptomyces sp. MP131-18]ONK13733.1 HEAT repeat [Streptomyces sp. MP131-18]